MTTDACRTWCHFVPPLIVIDCWSSLLSLLCRSALTCSRLEGRGDQLLRFDRTVLGRGGRERETNASEQFLITFQLQSSPSKHVVAHFNPFLHSLLFTAPVFSPSYCPHLVLLFFLWFWRENVVKETICLYFFSGCVNCWWKERNRDSTRSRPGEK